MAEPETAPENARSGIGASSSLPAIPAKVCLLNPQPALRLGGGNWYSCPFADQRRCVSNWLGWVDFCRTLRAGGFDRISLRLASPRPEMTPAARCQSRECRTRKCQMITRRTFSVGVGAGWLSTVIPVFAEQGPKKPRIGVLWHAGSAEKERIPLGGLLEGFKNFGYVDGENIILDHRFPNEQRDRFFTLAAELVQSKVDVLIAVTTQAA